MLLPVIHQATLLLSLCLLQALVGRFWPADSTRAKLVSGLLFGATCVAGMVTPILIIEGVIIDARSVVLSTTALFGGPLIAAVAGIIAIGYRVWLAGAGMWVGLAQILMAITLGLLYWRYRQRHSAALGPWHLLAFGAVVQVLNQGLITLLPAEYVLPTLAATAISMLVVMPIATLMLGSILNEIRKREVDDSQLRIAAKAFESLDGMLVTDASNRILGVNEAFTRITGYSADEANGQLPSMLGSGRQGAAFYQEMWQQLQTTGKWQGEVWNRRKDGEIYAEWLSIKAVRNGRGRVVNYVGSFADITGRKADEERIHKLAFFDALTGLPNRRLLLDRVNQAISATVRTHQCAALMFIDLDNFKGINDVHGHQAGDELLCLAAERLRELVRKSDTVARLGGDEFVVMLENLPGTLDAATAEAERVAGQLLTSLGEPYPFGELALHSSASIGVVLFSDDTCSLEELIRRADQVMYEAKAAGKHQVRFFAPRLLETAHARPV